MDHVWENFKHSPKPSVIIFKVNITRRKKGQIENFAFGIVIHVLRLFFIEKARTCPVHVFELPKSGEN